MTQNDRAHKICQLSQYQTKPAGALHDRECATCRKGYRCDGGTRPQMCKGYEAQVVSGAHIPAFQNEAGQTVCKTCPACPDGMVRRGCHRASPGYCQSCPAGHTKRSRFACGICTAGTYALAGMTCEVCQAGRYSQAGARGCTNCKVGEYQPMHHQGTCLPCVGWTHGRGQSMHGHSDAGHINCSSHTVCDVTSQWETKAATLTSDRTCADLTTCTASEWQSTAPSKHNDRECKPLTTCTDTQWVSVAPTATNDREGLA